MNALLHEVGAGIMGEDMMSFTDNWGTGCTDMGDVSCVMPALHPSIGGGAGVFHGKDFRVADPIMACVTSAKVQAAFLIRLLEEDAVQAKRVLSEGRQDYPTIPEYLAMIDALCIDKQAVVYDEERGAQLTF
jgi:hypothetical protein